MILYEGLEEGKMPVNICIYKRCGHTAFSPVHTSASLTESRGAVREETTNAIIIFVITIFCTNRRISKPALLDCQCDVLMCVSV